MTIELCKCFHPVSTKEAIDGPSYLEYMTAVIVTYNSDRYSTRLYSVFVNITVMATSVTFRMC